MKKIIIVSSSVFSFCAVLLFIFPTVVFAKTIITDTNISTSTTWMLSGSPYIVTTDLVVDPEATLHIDPGVIVKFEDTTGLTVYGGLDAQGSLQDKVYFTSDQDDSLGGDTNDDGEATSPSENNYWWLISINPNTRISNAVMRYSTNPLEFRATPLLAQDLSIDHCRAGINVVQTSAHLERLSMSDIGLRAIRIYHANVSIKDSTLSGTDKGEGVFVWDGSLVFDHSTSTHFESGLSFLRRVSATTTQSFIVNNKKGFKIIPDIYVETGGDPTASSTIYVRDTVIANNSQYGVWNETQHAYDFQKNWWGDPTGPYHYYQNPTGTGNKINGDLSFVPWLTSAPHENVSCCSNVLFIPGLEASRLYRQESSENKLWEPNRNLDAQKLFLDSLGHSLNQDIYTKEIVSSGFGYDIYEQFATSMNALVTDHSINYWQAMPYDWRLDLNDLVTNGTLRGDAGLTHRVNLVDEIMSVASTSQTGKVTIIAHSNGGLLGKLLIKKLEELGHGDLVDKFIMVGVPQLGTPRALGALLHGFDESLLKGIILKESVARDLAENMPGAHNLLPSEQYFSHVTDPVVTFDPSVSLVSDLQLYGPTVTDLGTLYDFLAGERDGRAEPQSNDLLHPNLLKRGFLSKATWLHQVIDTWQPSFAHVYQIAGWGLPTVRGINYKSRKDCLLCSSYLDFEPLFTREGDRTVMTASAVSMPVSTYYLNLSSYNKSLSLLGRTRDHKDLLETDPVQSLVKKIVKDDATSTLPMYITTTKPQVTSTDQSIHVAVHSPVDIDLYDSHANHTGLIQNLDSSSDLIRLEENIPNSYYVPFGEGKYAGTDIGSEESTIHFKGNGSGTATINFEKLIADRVIQSFEFSDIHVSTSTQAEISVTNQTNTPRLKIDQDGDGNYEQIITPKLLKVQPRSKKDLVQ